MSSAAVVASFSLLPGAISAQGLTLGSVSGQVQGPNGSGVSRAIVTLSVTGGGALRTVTTGPDGRFAIAMIAPGSYELRAEALGSRPLVVTGVTIRNGEETTVSATLTPTAPPVTSVDTVSAQGASASRLGSGRSHFGSRDLSELPSRFGDLASVVDLSSAWDAGMGTQGLPGETTLIVADGVPFYRAPHPTAQGEAQPDRLFGRPALVGVAAMRNAPDIEWSGASGGYVAVATESALTTSDVEGYGGYSGDPLWSSSELDLTTPSLTSFQGGARGAVAVGEASRLLLSGDAMRQETPLMPRVSEALAADLGGLAPELLTSLTEPSVEQYDRYSGMARLDVQSSATSHLFFRGVGAMTRRDFSGPGSVKPGAVLAPPEESLDFSTVMGLVSQSSETVSFEVRAGFSSSSRDFGSVSGDRSPAYLADGGALLGGLSAMAGESSRSDVTLTPVLHYAAAAGRFKFGSTIRISRHSMTHTSAPGGDFIYPDAASLLAGQGFATMTRADESAFGTHEIGLFAQYSSTLAPGMRLTLGGRYDRERLGTDGSDLNTDWLAASGLRTTDFTDGFDQFGARAALSWEPGVSGSTSVELAASLHEGDLDPRALHQVFSQDVAGEVSRFAGAGLGWPPADPATLPATAVPTLTLLGPDARAPRTVDLTIGVTQRVADGLSVFAERSTRRTDFLMRRRNLNLPLVPQAMDPNGRPIYGSLAQDGSIVTTTSDDARRFPAFAEVWALDPDGWSEYVGFTGGIEYSMGAFDLVASHTYSETTDNWIGAGSGLPGASQSPLLPAATDGGAEWGEGTSDFDVPHRTVATATYTAGAVSVSGVYRFSTGAPFTPRFRRGVDANGDGSVDNDVAYVPGEAELAALLDGSPCLEGQMDGFAVRNSCRGPNRQALDARIAFRLGSVGGRLASLTFDAFNIVEPKGGIVDDALWLVDPSATTTTSPDGSTVTIPLTVNEGFGEVLYPTSRGRMLRIGVRIGG